jgi:hypothetical protein
MNYLIEDLLKIHTSKIKPSLAVFVLKGHKYNREKTYARFKYLKTKSLVIHFWHANQFLVG